MKTIARFSLGFVALFTLLNLFYASPALAIDANDYNNQVAQAQAKIDDLQGQLNQAQADLDSWTSNSDAKSATINDAQSAVMLAQDALDLAKTTYDSKKANYDAFYGDVVVAQNKVADAITSVNDASDLVDSTYTSYLISQTNADNAQLTVNTAQIAYDTQLINVGGQGAQAGLKVDVYTGISKNGNPPTRSDVAYTFCKTLTVQQIANNWGSGSIFGCASDYVMLHYRGYITYSSNTRVYFQAQADDGFYMTIDGKQVINDWSLKGCGANSTGQFLFTANKSYAVDAWFYEWTGGACSTLNYQPTGGQWGVVPASMFTQDAVPTLVKDPALKIILDSKVAALVVAVKAEEDANKTYLDAETNYDNKNTIYLLLSQDLNTKKQGLSQYENVMSQAETVWQACSDSKAIADASLRDLKVEYESIFTAIQKAGQKVDDLQALLDQAKLELASIPKPTAKDKRKPKKQVVKYFADGVYLARQVFMPDPK